MISRTDAAAIPLPSKKRIENANTGLIVMALVVIYPILNVLHIFVPYRIFGKNIYIVIPAIIFVIFGSLIFFDERRKIIYHGLFRSVIFLGITAGVIWFAREILHEEGRSFLDFRYIFMAPIFSFVFANIINDQNRRDMLVQLVILTATIQSAIGIIHAHFFSYINIVADDSDFYMDTIFDRGREAGILISSNCYAAVIVCGIFLLVFYSFKNLRYQSGIGVYIRFMLMFYAVSLSGSRYSLAVAGFLGFVFLWKNFRRQFVQSFLLITLFLIVMILLYEEIEWLSMFRFGENSGGRLDKLLLPIELSLSGISEFLIGPSGLMTGDIVSEDGIGISDNSYMLMAMQFGVPFAFIWFVWFLTFCKKQLVSKKTKFLFVFFIFTLGLYNSILWEVWLFYFLLTFLCVSKNDAENKLVSRHCQL